MIQAESTPNHHCPANPYNEALSQRMKGDNCFACGNLGHWAQDCPNKSSPTKSPPSSPMVSDLPVFQCRCGAGACVVCVSGTSKNPNRKFYRCPGQCNFFKWCDGVSAPMCPCGAGRCSVNVEKEPPNKDRTYFACRIRKGHGACNFFQWTDVYKERVANGETSDTLGRMEVESTPMDHYEESPCTAAHELDDILNSKKLDEKLSNLSPHHVERSYVSDSEKSNLSPNSLSDDLSKEEASSLDVIEEKALSRCREIYSAENHRQQKEFLSKMAAAANNRHGGTDSVNMLLGIVGWYGQHAFPPLRCVAAPPPKPFYSCIFPSFDPITNLDQINLDSGNNKGKNLITFPCLPVSTVSDTPSVLSDMNATQVVPEASQLPNGVTSQTLISPEILENQVIGAQILEIFKEAALRIQDKFITRLESADFLDDKCIEQQATECFHALDRLSVDYQPFKEHVLYYIDCASTLEELERCANNEPSLWELAEKCIGKKRHFDEIASIHSKTKDDYSLCENTIQALRKDHSRVKKKLVQIEHELCDYEAKYVELEGRLGEICRDMEESKRSLERASQEKAEAAKALQQREMDRIAAKARLEKARAELRK